MKEIGSGSRTLFSWVLLGAAGCWALGTGHDTLGCTGANRIAVRPGGAATHSLPVRIAAMPPSELEVRSMEFLPYTSTCHVKVQLRQLWK